MNIWCGKSGPRCNTLLRLDNQDPQLVSLKCVQDSTDIILIAIAKVSHAKASLVRVFIDPGAQSSYVSPELVKTLGLELGSKRKLPEALGCEQRLESFESCQLTIMGLVNQPHVMEALVQPFFDMDMPALSTACVQQWVESRMPFSDQPGELVSEKTYVFIGADYCNEFPWLAALCSAL